ncbi:MAG: hypothetical protein ACK4SZ_11810 [Allosphingosinicella sp.]|uniref:hypothetical protein n=1 Tax=Allosphingosinicella sp. TaxID=2823234 RepID=UPI00393D411E
MRLAVVALSALLVASPAYAIGQSSTTGGASVRSSNEGPQGPSEAGTNANGERRICRRIESSANRTSARRVCLTAREWRDYDRSLAD